MQSINLTQDKDTAFTRRVYDAREEVSPWH
jgi:hypothetical protein